MKFFKRKYVGKRRFQAEWENAIQAYRSHLGSIANALPQPAAKLLEHDKRRPFHDAGVERLVRTGPQLLTVELDDRTLAFSGVRACDCPELGDDGDTWLYWEVDLAPRGCFELRAIWQSNDFRVVAEDVRIYCKLQRRWLGD